MLMVVAGWFFSCTSSPEQTDPSSAEIRESMIRVNRELAKKESDAIDNYIRRRNLKMERTGTGLRYCFLEKNDAGTAARTGMKATVKYTVALLDGTTCYSSDSTGPETFLIDQDNVESGLHEAIKLMHTGDRAKFILPSHLAHGLLGDRACITALSPVVYDIELIHLNQ